MPQHEAVKFLLVDDIDANLAALEALLRQDGLEMLRAKSGPEALELLLMHDVALALLDVQMPGMDGFELAEIMRATERTRRVPIIFLTAVATDERRRFRGYEAGAVDYLCKPLDSQLLRNKAAVFFELAAQRQALARQRDTLQQTAEQLGKALAQLQAHGDNSPLGIVEFDAEFKITAWSNGAERMFGWRQAEVAGRELKSLGWMHADDLERFAASFSDVLNGRQSRTVEPCRAYCKDGSVLQCEWYSSALRDAEGRLISINAQILDVTERKRAEETQQLLIGELNHRVKNTLASVQAIASQTLRHSGNPAEFAANFTGRIQSLARAHSLLSSRTWRGASLADVIQDQCESGTIDPARFAASGPEVQLSPQGALHIALIVHELGTNANKYGALSTPAGRIAVSWQVEDGLLHLRWEERGGPPVKAPSKRGFGTTLIERSVRAEGGSAHIAYGADGIAWDITMALPSPTAESERWSAAPVSTPAPSRAPAAPRGGNRLDGLRLLVIEDEPLVALQLANALEDAGADVVGPTGTAKEALQLIATQPLDGALLDGNLHGSPVDEIAAQLTRRNVPFLFVSGYGKDGLPRAFGNAPVLGKPFSDAQLIEAVGRLTVRAGQVVLLRR